MNRLARLAALLLLGVVTAGPAAEQPPDPLAGLLKQQRDAARKTYEVSWTNYREGRLPAEVVYRWSRRWLDAERQLSAQPDDRILACSAHLQRMVELEQLVRRLQPSGQVTVDEVSAAEYYRVEAEVWLAQARKEKKNR
jgi:hypothetical protein